jgi:hypothetical protein
MCTTTTKTVTQGSHFAETVKRFAKGSVDGSARCVSRFVGPFVHSGSSGRDGLLAGEAVGGAGMAVRRIGDFRGVLDTIRPVRNQEDRS